LKNNQFMANEDTWTEVDVKVDGEQGRNALQITVATQDRTRL